MAVTQTDEVQALSNPEDKIWLQRCRDAYTRSIDYQKANWTKEWEDNYRHFQSRHSQGSKYNKNAYKYRSRFFRPKTRSTIRNNEAAISAAFFNNQDIVSVEAMNPNDIMQRASADINQELLNYRLTKTIPWYQTCIAACQEMMVVGCVCSEQYWNYMEVVTNEVVPALDEDGNPYLDENGEIATDTIEVIDVKKDTSAIKLHPAENVHFHPAAEWWDPVNTSPFFIVVYPMYVQDVKAKMNDVNPKTGEPKWKSLSDGQLKAGIKTDYQSTRIEREKLKEDREENENGESISDFDVVYVHRNYMMIDGEDFVYYSLGIEHMLTDPVPISEFHATGERPYVFGVSVIEAHKVMPDSVVKLGTPTQKEINEHTNQRYDNVKLVLNKRWFVKRGSQVDIKSITRNVAGSVTLVNDVVKDVREQDFNDITSSSYQEIDRLNADFDEIAGNFSTSSVQTNRAFNETVGGMAMLKGNTNNLVEYVIKTMSETWVEKVMNQLIKLEQHYEDDLTLIALSGEKAQLYQKYGINEITDELLNQDLTTTVNMGMGATDPIMKLQHFMTGIRTILDVLTTTPPGTLDVMEVAKEVFGKLGFKDGMRFFVQEMGEDPEKMQMQQAIEQMQAMIQQYEAALNDKGADRQVKLLESKMKEDGQNKRKDADIQASLALKTMDLLNPVPGEQRPYGINT
jgi:hypothetical protein